MCNTRWVQRHEATLLFREVLTPIYDTLTAIDKWGANEARSLQLGLECPNFIVALCILNKTLGATVTLSKALQTKSVDLVAAMMHVHAIIDLLLQWRDEEGTDSCWQQIWDDASDAAQKLGMYRE